MSALRRPHAWRICLYLSILQLLTACNGLLYHPDRSPPDLERAEVELVTLVSEPDLALSHLYQPPRQPVGPLVVVFHGNGGHAGHRVDKFRDLRDAGFGLFFVEYRGYGGNPGQPNEARLTADARSVMAYLEAEGVDFARLVLYGESLGTGLAVKMAAEYRVAGLILEAPYTTIIEVGEYHAGILPVDWLIPDKWNLAARLPEVSAPLLVLHGEADQVIPIEFGRRVFALAPEPKAALFHPTADHNDLFAYPQVVARVIAFVREQVRE